MNYFKNKTGLFPVIGAGICFLFSLILLILSAGPTVASTIGPNNQLTRVFPVGMVVCSVFSMILSIPAFILALSCFKKKKGNKALNLVTSIFGTFIIVLLFVGLLHINGQISPLSNLQYTIVDNGKVVQKDAVNGNLAGAIFTFGTLALLMGALPLGGFPFLVFLLPLILREDGGEEAKKAPAKMPAKAPAKDDALGELEKVKKLHDEGVLNDEEFAEAKKKIIGKM